MSFVNDLLNYTGNVLQVCRWGDPLNRSSYSLVSFQNFIDYFAVIRSMFLTTRATINQCCFYAA